MSAIPRVAFIVSHPVQYYAPLYQRLAARRDIAIKVFFTWHAGAQYADRGFGRSIEWDIPLTSGYEHEMVPNVSSDAGPHHFAGFNNPELIDRVLRWSPQAVHITGWAWRSHLLAMRAFHRLGIPLLFRGDSHLLDRPRRGITWQIKRAALRIVYSWPARFPYVGSANRAYYEAFGVPAERLFYCPHSIDVARFAGRAAEHEAAAAAWREQLGLVGGQLAVLYAGKFENRKQTVALMRAFATNDHANVVLILVGSGEQDAQVAEIASRRPERFRVLPFQNQSRMPIVYRLGDIFVLASAHSETWGLGVNEALASGRPVLVSDRVGCAADVVDNSCGRVFPWNDLGRAAAFAAELSESKDELVSMAQAASERAWRFDIGVTEETLMNCLKELLDR